MFREGLDLFHLYVSSIRNDRLKSREFLPLIRLVTLLFIKDLVKNYSNYSKKVKVRSKDWEGRKLVFVDTYNNYEALKFLTHRYPDTVLATSGGYAKRLPGIINLREVLYSYNRFDKYLFLVYLAIHPRYRIRHCELIIKSYGFVYRYVALLRKSRPACIFISNDHFPFSRALILAARKMKIKCVYIQHASVTSHFPPLKSSHSLLYGSYSESIYKSIRGTTGTLIKVGNHRFDGLQELVLSKKKTRAIGVAYNTRNSVSAVYNLCEQLSTNLPNVDIIVRPHPGDSRKVTTRFQLSVAKQENSIQFLSRVDVVVAGNSSILLEAALMNVYPIQYYFDQVPQYLIDYYGFIKTGIVDEVTSEGKLIRTIREVLETTDCTTRERAKIYDASVNEPFAFHVEEKMVQVIDKILLSQYD